MQTSETFSRKLLLKKCPQSRTRTNLGEKKNKTCAFSKILQRRNQGKIAQKSGLTLRPSKNRNTQIGLSPYEDALKSQISKKILTKIAIAKLRQIFQGHQNRSFPEILQRKVKRKNRTKIRQIHGLKKTSTQIKQSLKKHALRVQSSENFLAKTAAPNSGNFSKNTKIGNFLRFFNGKNKEKSLKK